MASFFRRVSRGGLGWSSIVSVHFGAQYRASDCLYLRLGYQYNDSPISSADTFFNVASPLITQHLVSTGLSYYLSENLSASLAYVHGFENSSSGPINVSGVGPVAGTNVTSCVSADALVFGCTLQY